MLYGNIIHKIPAGLFKFAENLLSLHLEWQSSSPSLRARLIDWLIDFFAWRSGKALICKGYMCSGTSIDSN